MTAKYTKIAFHFPRKTPLSWWYSKARNPRKSEASTALYLSFLPPLFGLPLLHVVEVTTLSPTLTSGYCGLDSWCRNRGDKFKKIYMALGANDLMLYIRRLVYSSVRFGYQYACDYPIVLGAGILLLLLQRLCPSLFNFLLSSFPVFLLTALLLGALLSHGPVIIDNQQTLSFKSNISIIDCSINTVETAVEEHLENTTGSNEDDDMQDTQYEEKNNTYMTADTVLSEEVYIKDGTSDYNLHDIHEGKDVTSIVTDSIPCVEPLGFAKNNLNMETEEHIVENRKMVELKECGSINLECGNSKVQNQYQLGEFMSSCWQPVMRRDNCSVSESDLSESSSDASMTDIIPMLEELHPLIDLQTGHPSLTFRDNLNTSSDENEDDLEEEDVRSDETELEGMEDVIDLNSLDMEKNNKLESMMDLQRAKNILKFELDKRLMDLQAADAVHKMEEASRFHVQVPSISTPWQNTLDTSNGSEEIIELPHVLDSAPCSLLPKRSLFDLPFDQNVDDDSQLRETWTPRSHFPSIRHIKHRNLHVCHSTRMHHNRLKPENDEINEKDAHDSQLNGDAKLEGNNCKLFGSLDSHIVEEIKILSAAISDVGVLEANYGMNDVNKNFDLSDVISSSPIQPSLHKTCEMRDPDHADTIGEVNSLFKCRMEDVLVQSISESTISQPFTVNLEDDLSRLLSSDSASSAMHAIDASSVKELNSQFARLNEESMACLTASSTYHRESIQQDLSEGLPAGNVHSSKPQYEDKSRKLLTSGDQLSTGISGLQVIEAKSTNDINVFIKQHCEEPKKNTLEPPLQIIQKSNDLLSTDSEQTRSFSEPHGFEATSVEDIAVELHGSSCALHVVDAGSLEEEACLVKRLDKESQTIPIFGYAPHKTTDVELEGSPNETLSAEETNSQFKQVEQEAHPQMP
ncbi:hypothetical protein GUJ93_ZPchr0009g1173 [Zizania palustris]|uniref:Uncharacterized protein n=1 Tax=Zizania palustris TaxID=103762 RepID=A0A8J5VKN9_ZIZPA|nr:hypothetical protein GUJ93_ZPchr0009g1173 [Zizania palustris]